MLVSTKYKNPGSGTWRQNLGILNYKGGGVFQPGQDFRGSWKPLIIRGEYNRRAIINLSDMRASRRFQTPSQAMSNALKNLTGIFRGFPGEMADPVCFAASARRVPIRAPGTPGFYFGRGGFLFRTRGKNPGMHF